MKIYAIILVFALSGCGTFGLQNIRRSEAALEYASHIFSRFKYKTMLQTMKPPQADIKKIEPVRLYSTKNETLSVVQSGWNYIQSIHLVDGTECYAYILVHPDKSESFKHDSGSLYCFQDDKSYVKASL